MKANLLKQLKILKDIDFVGKESYYYLKPTDSLEPGFYCQPKMQQSRVPVHPIISYSGSPLDNLKKNKTNHRIRKA